MRIIIILIFIILSGCSVNPKPEILVKKSPTENKSAKAHASLTHWQAKGRLAASRADNGGNASFTWEQKGEKFEIKMWGPFGAGAVYLSGTPGHVEAREANGKKTTAQTPEALMKKVVGWQVPLTGLRYWILGLHSPHSQVKAQQLSANGKPLFFHQEGWHIHYNGFSHTDFGTLPNKISLQNGDLKVKMIITDWQQ